MCLIKIYLLHMSQIIIPRDIAEYINKFDVIIEYLEFVYIFSNILTINTKCLFYENQYYVRIID